MTSSGSLYLGTSVYLPSGQTPLEHERAKAQRVTTRPDGSVVLAYSSYLPDIPDSPAPFIPQKEWEAVASELRGVPYDGTELRTRGGLINMRLALWPEGPPIRALLTPEMLAGSNDVKADLYVSVSKSGDDTLADSGLIPIRVEALVPEIRAQDQVGQYGLNGNEARLIVESDAVVRQEKFERAFNIVVEDMNRLAPSTRASGQRRVAISYGAGHQGSGIVISSEMLEQLCLVNAELFISTLD